MQETDQAGAKECRRQACVCVCRIASWLASYCELHAVDIQPTTVVVSKEALRRTVGMSSWHGTCVGRCGNNAGLPRGTAHGNGRGHVCTCLACCACLP